MIKFINASTGTTMWVADERRQEYLEAGHKLASVPSSIKPTKTEEKKDIPKTKKK